MAFLSVRHRKAQYCCYDNSQSLHLTVANAFIYRPFFFSKPLFEVIYFHFINAIFTYIKFLLFSSLSHKHTHPHTVAWFTFDPILSGGAGSGLVFSNNNATVSVEGWEHRVALGSVGFSRGIHYWEFTVDKYTMDTDPAFGVARIDVNRNKMLGKC